MRYVLGCSTVLNLQVALCATVMSHLGLLLSICATLLIIWREPGSENVRVARVMETGVILFRIVLQVSQVFLVGRMYISMVLTSCHDYYFFRTRTLFNYFMGFAMFLHLLIYYLCKQVRNVI